MSPLTHLTPKTLYFCNDSLFAHSYNFIVKALGCVLYAMAYHDNPFELAVSRGGSLRLAVNNVKLDFPDDNQ